MSRPPARVSEDASFNFSVAKVVAIFTVVAGHWFTGTVLWIPVTFGLFIFAFSSGYFTARIYGVNLNRAQFWRKKIDRLAIRYWVALLFLAILLSARSREILDWETLIHFMGLSGVLNWIGVPNHSALGAGLWFFTLLLAFYVAYPFLAKLTESKTRAMWISGLSIVLAVALEDHVKVGHELWLTMLGFILGVAFGLHQLRVRPVAMLIAAIACCILLADLNLLTKYKQFNTALIASTSLLLSIWLSQAVLPKWQWVKVVAKLDQYLLEIFLIHSYLFIHLFANSPVDFVLSVVLTMFVAFALNLIVAFVQGIVDKRRIVARTFHSKQAVVAEK